MAMVDSTQGSHVVFADVFEEDDRIAVEVVNNEHLPDEFRCSKCEMFSPTLLRGSCRHGFCVFCASQSTSQETFVCNVDGTNLDKNELVEENNRCFLVNVIVHCLNKEFGCPNVLRLKDIQGHQRACKFSSVNCPNTCGRTVLRKDLPLHLQETCIDRSETCAFCKTDFIVRDQQVHIKECPQRLVSCKYCKEENILQENLSTHEDQCAMYQKARNEHQECSNLSVELLRLHDRAEDLRRKSWADHVTTLAVRDKVMMEIINTVDNKLEEQTNLTNEIIVINKKLLREKETLQSQLDELESKVEACHKDLQKEKALGKSMILNVIENVGMLQKRQDETRCCVMQTICSDQYVWTLKDIGDILERSDLLFSPEFVVAGTFGYRMQLYFKCWFREMFSVGFRIVNGQYDNSLTWPFKGQVRIRIMDQETGTNNLECLFTVKDLEKCPYAVRKPQKGEINQAMHSENMEQSLLDQIGNVYIRDDSVLLRCDADVF